MSQSRHDLLVALANLALDELSDEEIVELSPVDYGPEVTEDHLNYMWDQLYTNYDKMDDMELLEFWNKITAAKDAEIMARWMAGESDEEPNVIPNPSRTLH